VRIKAAFVYAVIHYRWVFVCFFLLPLSLLYEGNQPRRHQGANHSHCQNRYAPQRHVVEQPNKCGMTIK
jgi:hypothetical protein